MKRIAATLLCVLLASCVSAADVTPSTIAADKENAVSVAAPTGISVEKITFRGWKDAWRLSNRACELIVVPQISRVMYFGLNGGENLIWVAPTANGQSYCGPGSVWRNLGGDKIWPEPQSVWNWPPPYYFDNAPSDIEPIPAGIRLKTGSVAPHLGCVCVREFTLDAESARVNIRQRFEKSEGDPIALTVWNVTQVSKPAYALLPLGAEDEAKRRYRELADSKLEAPYFGVHETVLSLRNHEIYTKVGVSPDSDGINGWVAAVYPTCMLVESRNIQKSATYPDNNCHAELFSSSPEVGPYVELEMLSPLKTLKAGESLEDDMVWQIVTLTDAQSKDPEQAAAAARAVHATVLKREKTQSP
jgi:hypothetical protein